MNQAQITTPENPALGDEVVGKVAGWSEEARQAYRCLLRDLNEWCRSHHVSPVLNTWVAERVIQQVWG